MDKNIIKLWEENKDILRDYFTTTEQSEYDSYKMLVKVVVEKILNTNADWSSKYDADNITVVDDGDWRGTQIFIIPKRTYQPSADEYLVTYTWYGSCSGCDTLEAIHGCNYGLPDKEQVSDYMTLCLHLIQRMKPLYDEI